MVNIVKKKTLFDIVSVDFVGSSSLFERQKILHTKQYSAMILMLKVMLAGSALPFGLHHVLWAVGLCMNMSCAYQIKASNKWTTTGLSLRFHFISLDSLDVWSPIVICQWKPFECFYIVALTIDRHKIVEHFELRQFTHFCTFKR